MAQPALEDGRLYRRRELHDQYGGQQQGGISTPQARPFLLLFTGTGEHYGYQDGWDTNGVFLYSGEGQVGDMQFRAGNKAIRDHAREGKDLLLFAQVAKGQVRYLGCFACSTWEYREAKDKAGQSRKAIVFHLIPIDQEQSAITDHEFPRPVADASLSDLRERAFQGSNGGFAR